MNFADFFKAATGSTPDDCHRENRWSRGYAWLRPRFKSKDERDVGWRNVQEINSKFFECGDDLLDGRPAVFELLALLGP